MANCDRTEIGPMARANGYAVRCRARGSTHGRIRGRVDEKAEVQRIRRVLSLSLRLVFGCKMSIGILSAIFVPLRILLILISAFGVCTVVWIVNSIAWVLIRPFSNVLYRRITSIAFRSAFLYHGWFARNSGCKLEYYGEKFPKQSNTLLIMNHHATVDWVLLPGWLGDLGYPYPGNVKFIAKDSVGMVPLFGWVMQQMEWIFISRNWEKDYEVFMNGVRNVTQFSSDTNWPFCLVLFPEGTRMSPGKKQLSQEFAKNNGFPVFDHVLMPRFKGFKNLIPVLKDHIEYVVDATFVFNNVPTLSALMIGNQDITVRIHTKKFNINEIPLDEQGLQDWLLQRWVEKEERLKLFNDEPDSLGPIVNEGYNTPNYLPLIAVLALYLLGATGALCYASTFEHGIRNFILLCVLCILIASGSVVSNLMPKANDRVVERPTEETAHLLARSDDGTV